MAYTAYWNTAGTFTEADPGCIETVLSTIELRITQFWDKKKGDYGHSIRYHLLEVRLGGVTFKVTTVKLSKYGNLSIYLESEKIFLRISDHWSSGSSVRNVGFIRNCDWRLREKSQHIITAYQRKLQGGFIYKKKLRDI